MRNGNSEVRGTKFSALRVLIVPCGMETGSSEFRERTLTVLIVPCGMETIFEMSKGNNHLVLIVPCGMETAFND